MAKIGSMTVEVRPTVTLESAAACVVMLNLFLAGNEDYRLELDEDGEWHLIDEPLVPATGGILPHDKPSEYYGTSVAPLGNMKPQDGEVRPIVSGLFDTLGR